MSISGTARRFSINIRDKLVKMRIADISASNAAMQYIFHAIGYDSSRKIVSKKMFKLPRIRLKSKLIVKEKIIRTDSSAVKI